ncbi:LlaJI family restriction endonuclease [Sulfitobacter sp.]|uniref:LlaJI family restriction endonuclease n=1 Tax=Sulfitobacter sp. TaxID=1903071 RepID=UPI003EF131C9
MQYQKLSRKVQTPMMRADQPQFFSDRDPLGSLEHQAGSVVAAMRHWGLGRVDERETIHFCGLIHHPEKGAVLFLPREARTGDYTEDLKTASLTMRALAKFGAETSKREFEDDGETGNPGALSVIKRLADDFRDHGLFSERTRLQTRNSGKPDWGRTVKREIAMPDRNGQPVYTDIRANRAANTSEALLAQIQAAVLKEINVAHGWWLPGAVARKTELVSCSQPPFPRTTWARKLDALLPSLYSARSVFLAEYMRHYLRETRASTNGSFVFGVSDFHSVWEAVLRETIVRSAYDKRRNWNSKLPKPVYVHKADGTHDARSRGMQTDIILEDVTGYTIVDAKYYAAKSASSAPGWPDIAKQMFYEKALREVVETTSVPTTSIRNIFAFPSKTTNGPLSRVELQRIDGQPLGTDFPDIECAYISVASALELYVGGHQGVSL